MRASFWRFRNNLLALSLALYVAVCVPAYFVFVGPVGDVNAIPPQVVLGGLLVGSIVFVPLIHAVFEKYVEVITVQQAVGELTEDNAPE